MTKKTAKTLLGLSVLLAGIAPVQAQLIQGAKGGATALSKTSQRMALETPTHVAGISGKINRTLLERAIVNQVPSTTSKTPIHKVPVLDQPLNMDINFPGYPVLSEGRELLSRLHFRTEFWKQNPALWKSDEASQEFISKFLGWQKVYNWTLERVPEINAFAADVRKNFDHCILMGMGGSSLAPEVLRQVFGKQAGWPELIVLDTTNPDQISAARAKIDPARTLFIFASKSGGTVEPASQFAYFYNEVQTAGVAQPGQNFIAITDAGTGLEALAKEKNFRKTFLNPADVGGRFSALTYFGMVPAAIMGIDVERLLVNAQRDAYLFEGKNAPRVSNVAFSLGAYMGQNYLMGRDKLTLLMPKSIEPLGLWIEQLVAESLGKESKGILPVAGEKLHFNLPYMEDRFFVRIHTHTPADGTLSKFAENLKKRGYPVLTLDMESPYQIGSMFLAWEIATAAAGAQMRINPFDQPNVQAAKDMTKNILAQLKAGQLPQGINEPMLTSGSWEGLYDHLEDGDYVSLLAYLNPTPEVDAALTKVRDDIMTRTGHAVTLGYGPRYLHSTGQLHKGDGNNGVFIILTADPIQDVQIPGQDYTFGQLSNAQSLGDFQALDNNGRRALRIHLGSFATPVQLAQKIKEVFNK